MGQFWYRCSTVDTGLSGREPDCPTYDGKYDPHISQQILATFGKFAAQSALANLGVSLK